MRPNYKDNVGQRAYRYRLGLCIASYALTLRASVVVPVRCGSVPMPTLVWLHCCLYSCSRTNC